MAREKGVQRERGRRISGPQEIEWAYRGGKEGVDFAFCL